MLLKSQLKDTVTPRNEPLIIKLQNGSAPKYVKTTMAEFYHCNSMVIVIEPQGQKPFKKEFLEKPKDNNGDKNKCIEEIEAFNLFSYSKHQMRHNPQSNKHISSDKRPMYFRSYFLSHHIQLSTKNYKIWRKKARKISLKRQNKPMYQIRERFWDYQAGNLK